MKKLFNSILIFGLFCSIMMVSSCNGCKGGQPDDVTVSEDTIKAVSETPVGPLKVENTISTDKQGMYTQFTSDYRYFETCVRFKDFMDSEEFDGTIAGITNIFQAIYEDETGADVKVVFFDHTPEGSTMEVKNSFWLEDQALNDEAITVTFEEALERLMESNFPKPHSHQCVLRKAVGPNDANPQYIFGNATLQYYVDAVTGEVNAYNPVFGKGFKMPLGEWP